MPISKSAKKAYISSERKRVHNLVLLNNFKKALKKVNEGNVNQTISLIDKTAKRHVISQGRAARLKSRLTKKFGTPKKLKAKEIKEVATKKPTAKAKTAKPATKPKAK